MLLLTEVVWSAVQMIIRIFLDGSRSQWRDVTIDSETTCTGVIAECQGDDMKGSRASYYLAELCMGYGRELPLCMTVCNLLYFISYLSEMIFWKLT